MMDKQSNLIPAAFLAIGIAIAGYFVGNTMYKPTVGANTAEVKGLAERVVSANRASWQIRFTVQTKNLDQMPALYAESKSIENKIVSSLKENGFSNDEITRGIVTLNKAEYRDNNQRIVDRTNYLYGNITVESENVSLIAPARAKINELIAEGVDLDNNQPSYHFFISQSSMILFVALT